MGKIDQTFKDTQSTLFFLVGCPRSGTSLMQHILTMHGDVSMPPESWFFNIVKLFFGHDIDLEKPENFDRVLERFTRDKRWCRFDFDIARFESLARSGPKTLSGLFTAFGTAWREFHGCARFGEKSPENYQYMLELAEWFPEAKFIYVMRDPRATMVSHAKRLGAMRNVYRVMRLWVRGERFLQLGLKALGPARVQVVRYEDLVVSPEIEVNKVCDFLSLEFQEQMLNPHEREKAGFLPEEQAYMGNTQKPIFKDSIRAWENEASADKIAMVEYLVGRECLMRYGYESLSPKVRLLGLKVLCSRIGYYGSEYSRYPVRKFRIKFLKAWSVK